MSKIKSYEPCVFLPRGKDFVPECTPAGDKTYRKASLSFDPITGERVAEPGEVVNLDAYIQASAASTDIATIVEKFINGDDTVLNVHPGGGFYGDTTVLPTNINDVVETKRVMDKASASFEKLPDDIKALFGNDVNQYFNSILEAKADGIVKEYLASQQSKVEASVNAPQEEVK